MVRVPPASKKKGVTFGFQATEQWAQSRSQRFDRRETRKKLEPGSKQGRTFWHLHRSFSFMSKSHR